MIQGEKKQINTLDSLSPYVGKMRIDLTDWLIEHSASKNGYIYDPFSGSGTVLLEGWKNGFNVIGNDLNYYAYILAKGKLNPPKDLSTALCSIEVYNNIVNKKLDIDIVNSIPDWVKEFFHPQTLAEIKCWVNLLKNKEEWFFLACLLGILHHQRPGFLSYPASHGVPYLRDKKYPRGEFPEMYSYKNVYEKLSEKVKRVYKSIPALDFQINRVVKHENSLDINLKDIRIATIITSPPYMKSLTYARDNRLRLWFLGVEDWNELEKKISPDRMAFYKLMLGCFQKWSNLQTCGDKCILVIGDIEVNYANKKCRLPDVLVDLAQPYYRYIESFEDPIPYIKRVNKGISKIKTEKILVLERI